MGDSGILATREIVALGVSREYARRLASSGQIERVGRGLYSLPNADVTAFHSIAIAGKRVPTGVVCLLSALRLHGVITQAPADV